MRLRKEDANVFDSVSDDRLEWMERFVVWLNVWKSYNTQHDSGFLSKETFLALSHTVSTFVIMIRDLLSNGVLDYVLTGKFQTDQLESRFGHYRQLSGSNYLVSVADVLQSEKKLKVKRPVRRKAFDRLNYWLLFDKLLTKHVPLFIIKLLCFWYTHQTMFVRWGDTISTQFTVANGVKQGGVISPILFNVYMDDLSTALNSSGIGGYLGRAFINHLCYADDLCIITLSSSGMQQLLNICQSYAIKQQLLYNGSKSFTLCFKSKAITIKQPSFFLSELEIPMVEHCRYLGISSKIFNASRTFCLSME